MARIKHGDLVAVKGEHRKYVALTVSATACRLGVNVEKPGIHLFGGCWYKGDPLTIDPYGKVLDMKYLKPTDLRVVGRVRTRYAANHHCR